MTFSIPVHHGIPYRFDAPKPETVLEAVDFIVPGIAAPQGSKSPKGRTATGRIIMAESSKKVGPWRERVALAAAAAMGDLDILDGPVAIDIVFVLKRPVGTAKTKPTPPAIHRPDLDKLIRAVCDAITDVVVADDSKITSVRASKRIAELGEAPHTDIAVWGLA